MQSAKKAVVIGGGVGGLATASLLAKQGFKVTLLEKNDQLGGRARIWRRDGFQFDLGPSWYLMPEVFDNFFGLFGKKTADFYQLKRLDPNYRIFWDKGDFWDIPADKEALISQCDAWETNGARKMRDYLERAESLYRAAMEEFIYRDYARLGNLVSWPFLRALAKNRLYLSLESYIKRTFSNPRIWRLLEYTMVFLGTSPRQAPAIYALMSHVDFNLGVWYPVGGIGAVIEALEKLARSQGVVIKTGCEVKKVLTKSGQVTGVLAGGREFPARVVVASADYQHVEQNLLSFADRSFSQNYWQSRVLAPSALLVYAGINRRVANIRHHNLYFDEAWDEHFAAVFGGKNWPRRYSYYVSAPSKTDSIAAPAGKENLFFLIPVAPGLKDADKVREEYADKVMTHFSGLAGQDLLGRTSFRRIFSHRDFRSDYRAYRGTALGLAHTLLQTAVFRPPHRSRKLSNLYYVGHYTHPGVGVPPVLISAQIVAKRIADDVTRN